MVSDRAFIFHIYIPWSKTLSLVPQPRSSVKVKVKYQGQSFRKKNGISVSQTQLIGEFSSIFLFWKKALCLALEIFLLLGIIREEYSI